MMFQKLNISGLKIPFLATSIIPLEVSAHRRIQILAMMRIVFFGATFDQIAEFRKLTASFATQTIRSKIAKTKRMTINHSNIDHIGCEEIKNFSIHKKPYCLVSSFILCGCKMFIVLFD